MRPAPSSGPSQEGLSSAVIDLARDGSPPENGAEGGGRHAPLVAWVLVTAVIAIGITVGSMLADVVDEGELQTGERQEGMFMSTVAFTSKAVSGVGSFLAGLALDLIAFPSQADPGSVDPDKVFQLGLVVGPGLMLLYLVTLIFLSRYPITRSRHQQILAELEQRRGEIG